MKIFCCGCNNKVQARLTYGTEIYPHRKDLHQRPFLKCDDCKNFVGCHYKTPKPTRPLGCIPTIEIRNLRNKIHRILDKKWENSPNPKKTRSELYYKISEFLGYSFHTAETKTIEECEKIYNFIFNNINN